MTNDIPIPEELKRELRGLGVMALVGMQHRAEQGGDTFRARWVALYLKRVSRSYVAVKAATHNEDPDCRWGN